MRIIGVFILLSFCSVSNADIVGISNLNEVSTGNPAEYVSLTGSTFNSIGISTGGTSPTSLQVKSIVLKIFNNDASSAITSMSLKFNNSSYSRNGLNIGAQSFGLVDFNVLSSNFFIQNSAINTIDLDNFSFTGGVAQWATTDVSDYASSLDYSVAFQNYDSPPVQFSVVMVPEPGTMLLGGIAAVAGGGGVWLRRRKKAVEPVKTCF